MGHGAWHEKGELVQGSLRKRHKARNWFGSGYISAPELDCGVVIYQQTECCQSVHERTSLFCTIRTLLNSFVAALQQAVVCSLARVAEGL